MAQTGWVSACPWRQGVFYLRTTHLVTYTDSHGTCALLCWQWVLDICTPLWKQVTSFSKPDGVGKVQSVRILKVFDGTSPREECTMFFNKPGQISSGSSSYRCVRVPGYTWPLTTLQSRTINQSNVSVKVDLLAILEHIEGTHEKYPGGPLNAMNGNVVLGILGLSTLGENVLIISNWTILRSR